MQGQSPWKLEYFGNSKDSDKDFRKELIFRVNPVTRWSFNQGEPSSEKHACSNAYKTTKQENLKNLWCVTWIKKEVSSQTTSTLDFRLLRTIKKTKLKIQKWDQGNCPLPPQTCNKFEFLPFSQEGRWLGQTSEYTHRAISVAKYLSCSTGILQNWDFLMKSLFWRPSESQQFRYT